MPNPGEDVEGVGEAEAIAAELSVPAADGADGRETDGVGVGVETVAPAAAVPSLPRSLLRLRRAPATALQTLPSSGPHLKPNQSFRDAKEMDREALILD